MVDGSRDYWYLFKIANEVGKQAYAFLEEVEQLVLHLEPTNSFITEIKSGAYGSSLGESEWVYSSELRNFRFKKKRDRSFKYVLGTQVLLFDNNQTVLVNESSVLIVGFSYDPDTDYDCNDNMLEKGVWVEDFQICCDDRLVWKKGVKSSFCRDVEWNFAIPLSEFSNQKDIKEKLKPILNLLLQGKEGIDKHAPELAECLKAANASKFGFG